MNKLHIIAIIAILAVSQAALPTMSRADTKLSLAEIDQDTFGSTIISAISLNMAVESPLEDITLLLDEIMKEITTEQQAADEKNRTDQVDCENRINKLVTSLNELRKQLDTAKQSHKDNTDILTQAKIDLKQANKDYDETVKSIETGTAQREKEHARWAQEDYENSISIATLEEGVKLITHMIHGVAFSQIKTRYDKVLEKLRDNESKHASLFQPLITSLTQIASKLNYENVMKILQLLQKIRTSILEEQTIAKQGEERAQADWEQLLAHLTQQKATLTAKINRLNALITSTTQLLQRLTQQINFLNQSITFTEQALLATRKWCAEQSATYQTESKERGRELEILNKLKAHLQERFSQVSEYVSSRK